MGLSIMPHPGYCQKCDIYYDIRDGHNCTATLLARLAEQIKKMPPEELRALIESHMNGDVAQLLQYATIENLILNKDDEDKKDNG